MKKMVRFNRPFKSSAPPLYWLMFGYLVGGWLFPVVGWALLFFIVGTVLTAFWRGRWWCGHVCPRSNMYLKLLTRYSPHRPIPGVVRTWWFRLLVVVLVFMLFTVRLYQAWGDWGAMGSVFWRMFLATTVIGVVLCFVYAPLTWCSFCPMGTLAAWAAPRRQPLPEGFSRVVVSSRCHEVCRQCARVCPMQLSPYASKGKSAGYLHPDCFKCGYCTEACPHGAATILKEIKQRTYG